MCLVPMGVSSIENEPLRTRLRPAQPAAVFETELPTLEVTEKRNVGRASIGVRMRVTPQIAVNRDAVDVGPQHTADQAEQLTMLTLWVPHREGRLAFMAILRLSDVGAGPRKFCGGRAGQPLHAIHLLLSRTRRPSAGTLEGEGRKRSRKDMTRSAHTPRGPTAAGMRVAHARGVT